MEPRKQQYRLGLFVAVAGVLLCAMILIFGGSPQRWLVSKDAYTIVFDDAPGISPGTPVRRSGVRIGSVSSVELDDSTGEVRIGILIDKKYKIRTNESPVISQDLLSRDTTIDFVPNLPTISLPNLQSPPPKPVEPDPPRLEPPVPIEKVKPVKYQEPGEPKPAPKQPAAPPPPALGEPVPPGSIIRGKSPTDARTIMAQASDIIPTVQQSLSSIRRSVERFEQMVPFLEEAVREFAMLGRSVRETVPEVRRTNDELRALLQNVRLFLPSIRKSNEELQLTLRNFGQVGETVNVLIQTNQERFVKALDQSTDVLQKISQVLNEDNQKSFTATLRATQAASANFESITRNADELLREGQKTLANISAATKPFAERSERVLRNIDASFDQVNKILASFGEAMAPAGSGGGTVQKFFGDPSLYNNLNCAALQVAKLVPRLDRILHDFETFADKVARHPESIGIGGVVRPSAGLKEARRSRIGSVPNLG